MSAPLRLALFAITLGASLANNRAPDASDILQDLSTYSKLYVTYQNCAWSTYETGAVNACGVAAGLLIGCLLAWILVKLMTHVFDPPPDTMAIPWLYLSLLALAGLVAMVAADLLQLRKRNVPLSFAIRAV